MIKQDDPHKRGKAAKRKGKTAELSLMHLLNEQYGFHTRRGKTYYHESDLVGLEGIHVECKFQEKLNLLKAMEQAVEEAEKRDDGIPTVFHKKSRSDWLVTMRLFDWVDLYCAWLDWRPSEHK